jgi:hypothetical protein
VLNNQAQSDYTALGRSLFRLLNLLSCSQDHPGKTGRPYGFGLTHTHVYTHTRVHTHTGETIWLWLSTHTRVHTHTCTHTRGRPYFGLAHTHVYTHTRGRPYFGLAHTHVYTHTRVHTHTGETIWLWLNTRGPHGVVPCTVLRSLAPFCAMVDNQMQCPCTI